jgi:putative DNA-invertase from lambdoid prophage Rac
MVWRGSGFRKPLSLPRPRRRGCPQGYARTDSAPSFELASVWVDFAIWTCIYTDTTSKDQPTSMRTILYCRVSSADQTIAHQETQARAAGFAIDAVVSDDGVSGVATTLAEREQGKRLFDLLRAGDVLVVRWVDRLGRNYRDVCDNIREFMKRGVVIKTVINSLTFDGATKDPMQQAVRDALIGFMAALSQAQAEATKEAQRAGIAYAKANADADAYLGRKPSFTREQLATVRDMLANESAISAIAKATGLSRQTVYRIKGEPVWADTLLARWDVKAAA